MIHPIRSIWIMSTAFGVGIASPAGAQAPDVGTVTGHGTAEVRRPAERMRVQMDILAKGKDIKEALARLKERREADERQLAGLGAIKDTVHFGPPMVGSEKTDRQRQMEMMVMQRMRAQGKKAQKDKAAPPVVVQMSLKAEWPLSSTAPEELLAAATALQEKIKAADLGGTKGLKETSPQEEELAEEAASMGGMEDPSEPKRGEPIFLFVSKVNENERAKLLAEAFQKARREADRLARAADSQLGSLHHLDSTPGGEGPTGDDMTSYAANPYQYQMWQMTQRNQPSDLDSQSEAVSPQPGRTVFRVTVVASFRLKEPAK